MKIWRSRRRLQDARNVFGSTIRCPSSRVRCGCQAWQNKRRPPQGRRRQRDEIITLLPFGSQQVSYPPEPALRVPFARAFCLISQRFPYRRAIDLSRTNERKSSLRSSVRISDRVVRLTHSSRSLSISLLTARKVPSCGPAPHVSDDGLATFIHASPGAPPASPCLTHTESDRAGSR